MDNNKNTLEKLIMQEYSDSFLGLLAKKLIKRKDDLEINNQFMENTNSKSKSLENIVIVLGAVADFLIMTERG